MSYVTELLATAAKTIGQRAEGRDVQEERSMAATVNAFNAIFGTTLKESEGWAFMQILKMVRGKTDVQNPDDYVDGAAYTALGAEARMKEDESVSGTPNQSKNNPNGVLPPRVNDLEKILRSIEKPTNPVA